MKPETREIVYFLLNTNLNLDVRENIKAELEALEADRKRLEWLLENEYNVYESGTGDFYIHDWGEALMQNPKNYNCGWHTAREAIDAAMKEQDDAYPG